MIPAEKVHFNSQEGNRMRVLVVGKKQAMHWPEAVARSFPDGTIVRLFLFNAIWPYRFAKMFGRSAQAWISAAALRRVLRMSHPDLIVFVSAFFIPEACYRALDEFPEIKRIGWIGDDFIADEVRTRADRLNVLYCSDSGFIPKASVFRCCAKFLPLCADTKTFFNKHLPKTLPPFFVGAANPERISFLQSVRTHCLIYGYGWPRMPQHEVHNRRLTYDETCDFINRSIAPFNLNFSPNNINGLNFRPFEISACGQPIITNHMPDLYRCYDAGREAVVFSTPDEFDAVMERLVRHPSSFAALAHEAEKRTIETHAFSVRSLTILTHLKQKPIFDET